MRPDDIHGKRVLISPLNWGFGHVSRCIGLIHQLLHQDNQVIIACDFEQEGVFREYFPSLKYEPHEGYPFKFGGKGHFALDLIKSSSGLRRRLKEEQAETTKLVAKHKIDVVLSDHRYGFYSKQVRSIFITHQFNLPVSLLQLPVDNYHKKCMKPFQNIWIMDYPDNRLAGKLSRTNKSEGIEFIGPYSRFSIYDIPKDKTGTIVVISGPFVYAKQLVETVGTTYPEAHYVCPTSIELPLGASRIEGGWKEQDIAMLNAKTIVSRSGYSTIMDLQFLGAKGVFFPTPGQAEQLYLNSLIKGSD